MSRPDVLGTLDVTDVTTIEVLLEDGRLSMTKLTEVAGRSKNPCHQRVKRLMKNGVIRRFHVVVDPRKLGVARVAHAEVELSDTRDAALQDFNHTVVRIREIEERPMIAGSYDYLLKVRTATNEKNSRVLGECISTLPHLAKHFHVCSDGICQTAVGVG
ncbi:Lrp/AsnC family transcriptional regulator [Rhizobium leguminosarum]